MTQNIFDDIRTCLDTVLQDIATEASAALTDESLAKLTVEPPRDASHGDMATNAAMVLSKVFGMKPRDLAEKIEAGLRGDAYQDKIADVSIAGPGFLNIKLHEDVWRAQLSTILGKGSDYGSSSMGQGAKINVEYVSANPTGPLTVAHARGAILGDALANLLEKAGYDIQREYYTNDAGNQVRILGQSTFLRYREALGEDIGEIPAGHYPGEYLKDVAQAIADKDGDQWLKDSDVADDGMAQGKTLDYFRDFAIEYLMAEIKKDLSDLGVNQDLFYSERSAVENGSVDRALDTLDKLGLIYTGVLEPPKGKEPPEDWEAKPQTLFKSTDFGDDVDRAVRKADGNNTYFANDIAHYYDIFKMGYPTLINVVGADHGGYVKRAKAAVDAVTEGKGALHMPLCAIVRVFDKGEPIRMSKRAGNFVTLRDVLERSGAGVMRFIMLTRKAQETLDFDLTKAMELSKDNPVFYVQYAHARCCSVLRRAADMFGESSVSAEQLLGRDMSTLKHESELQFVKLLASWPRLVEQAASAQEPHRIAFYLQDVAASLHSWWNMGRDDATMRFLVDDDEALSLARVALVQAAAFVIRSGLDVIGVDAMEEMQSEIDMEAA